jgi:hypothetical protein
MSARSLTPSRRLHRLLCTTTAGAPRLWARAYEIAGRAYGAYLVRGERPAAVYLRGSQGAGDPVHGLSDIDIAVLAPPGRRMRVRARWRRARRLLGDLLFDWPLVLEPPDLRDCAATTRTFGLAAEVSAEREGQSLYWGRGADEDRTRLAERPELYAATAGWRLVRGPELRPPEQERPLPERGHAAWLLLQHWWRLLFPVCIDPSGPRTAYLCWKLYAEPARIWLWLARDERFDLREPALRRAAMALPEEAEAMERALALGRALHRSPAPPLDEVTPYLVRMSGRIAALLGAQAERTAATEVVLDWGGPNELVLPLGGLAGDQGRGPGLLPLVDWRAFVIGRLPDETFGLLPDDPSDAAALARGAHMGAQGAYPVLAADGLLVLLTSSWKRTRLRAVQCAVSDPVSTALVSGANAARFPDLPGWSARDCAQRAVAEHRVALREPHPEGHSGHELARLVTAARAALMLESLETDRPVLPLTVAATLRSLASRSEERAATAAMESYREFAYDWRPIPAAVLADLRRAVLALPAYAERSSGNQPSSAAAGSSRS